MSQLTTEQLVKIIIGIFVFVAVIVGIYLFFRYNVISFFKGYTDEENPIQTGETEETTTETKSYKINSVGFKIGGITYNKDVVRTGTVSLVVSPEDSCDSVECQVWANPAFTVKQWCMVDYMVVLSGGKLIITCPTVNEEYGKLIMSLDDTNTILNALERGKYHVSCYCWKDGKRINDDEVTSPTLEIKPKKSCEDCNDFLGTCSEELCNEISNGQEESGLKCIYTPRAFFKLAKCTTTPL